MKEVKEILIKNKPLFEDLIKRKFVYGHAAEIYGGFAGLFDLGPIGCALQSNFFKLFREHFIVQEDLLELSCTNLTPQVVLKNSGHEARFTDWMVKDEKTEETFRADHLIEDFIEKKIEDKNTKDDERQELKLILANIPNFQNEIDFDNVMDKLQIKNPNNKNQLSKCYKFNLMFKTTLGPQGNQIAYLRPETAQGIFTNFNKLLDFNNGQLPFGGVTLGKGFRNEISPRNGLLRVREFDMAEIEYFIDPLNKSHPLFKDVKDLQITLFDKNTQESAQDAKSFSLQQALDEKIIDSEILAYFIGKIYQFMIKLGIRSDLIRFRQHQKGEMAHYANDCWDAELFTSVGWIECVGLADRSAYDLNAHSIGSGKKLQASRVLKTPEQRTFLEPLINKGYIGKTFKQQGQKIIAIIEELAQDELKCLKEEIELQGKSKLGEFEITKEMITKWEEKSKFVQEEKFIPNVIEPSFGVGRILYCLLEQSFRVRENDQQRTFFEFNDYMAPFKVAILSLQRKDELIEIVKQLELKLKVKNILCRVDNGSSSIGKRYSRCDELGIPYAITIDFDTIEDKKVTLRNLKDTKQIRIDIVNIEKIIKNIIKGKLSFNQLLEQYGEFKIQIDQNDN